MSRELLKQALYALKYHSIQIRPIDLTNETIEALRQELAKQEFYPDWDMLKPYHERIKELEQQLAKPEQEPNFCKDCGKGLLGKDHIHTCSPQVKRQWVGLTSEDWENTPDTGKQGCERDAELYDWIEQTLKDKNEPSCS